MKYTIILEPNPTPEDIQILCDGISHEAQKKKQLKSVNFFAFFIRDNDEKIVGGCNGAILHDWSYVDQLWVSESLRGQGYGTQLMLSAEKLAADHKSRFITVNSYNWEAPNFYKKLGFYVEFERHNPEKDSTFYFFRKDL